MRSRSVSIDLALLKKHSSPKRVLEWLPRLLELSKVKQALVSEPGPDSYSKFVSEINVLSSGIEMEIAWTGSILIAHHEKIVRWLSHSSRIEELTFSGHYQDALEKLDEIENEIGLSYWGIDTRMQLLTLAEGVEGQKAFAKALWSDTATPEVVQCYTYYASLRCEPRVSCWRYDSQVIQACAGIEPSARSSAESYFSFLVNFFGPKQFNDLGDILWRTSQFPIIDQYLTFVRCVTLITALAQNTGSLPAILRSVIEQLLSRVGDSRLINVLIGLGAPTKAVKYPCNLIECLDHYTSGDYNESAALAARALELMPNHFEFVELLAKSIGRAGVPISIELVPTDLRGIVDDMVAVLTKSADAERALNALRKRCYVWPHCQFSAQLYGFCHREFTSDGFVFSRHFTAFGELASKCANPRIVFTIQNPDCRQRFVRDLLDLYPNSPTIRLYASLTASSGSVTFDGVESARARLFLARHQLREGRWTEVFENLDLIGETKDPLLAQDVVLTRNRASIESADWPISVRHMAEAFLRNPVILNRLPVREVLTRIRDAKAERLCGRDIAFCILTHAYCEQYGTEFESVRDNAYEDFLDHMNIARPSELNDTKEIFDQRQLTYFLRHVCVESVLDNSVEFRGTEDLQQERIAIYRILIEIDQKDIEHYSEQIKEITKTLVVRRLVRQVEQSGIHVEVQGIKRGIENSLRESYNRYLELSGGSDDGIAADLLVRLGRALGAESQRFHIVIPGDQRFALLRDMFAEVRDEFVSSNEFGLDGYLSTGMRHGTLSGQVRAPFEELNLITQRDDATGVYREPHWWLKEYSKQSSERKQRISKAIQEFSRDIDALIEKTRAQWIQIRTEKREGEGLFDFRISTLAILELQRSLTSETTFESFVEMVFARLWDITDQCLERIREKISDVLKNEIMTSVTNLEHEVQDILIGVSNAEILAKITRARTEAQYAVDKIANWFTRAPTPETEPYPLDLPISIASEMIRNLFPSTRLRIESNVNTDLKFAGRSLKGVVQIVFILLENVRKHSGIVEGESPVWITVTHGLDVLTICVENELNPLPLVADRQKNLDAVLKRVKGEQRFESVAREKGSGLQKIERILRVDLDCDPTQSFQFLKDGRFQAKLTLNTQPLAA